MLLALDCQIMWLYFIWMLVILRGEYANLGANFVTQLCLLAENIFCGSDAEDWDSMFIQSDTIGLVNSVINGNNGENKKLHE